MFFSLSWCLCVGCGCVLWWCGGVLVFLCWCLFDCVFVVVWLCFCGGVFVVAWLCFCDGVFVFSWLCFWLFL